MRKLIGVFLFFATVFGLAQYRVPEIIGYDGWIHMKMASVFVESGFIQNFPFITESILAQSYSDWQWLYRVLLIPFTLFGLMNGAKVAAIVFGALCFTFFYWYLSTIKIKYPFLFTTLFAFASIDLIYRFLLPRPMPLMIISLLLTTHFVAKQNYKALFFSVLCSVWINPGFVFHMLIIIVHAFIHGMKKEVKSIIAGASGIIIGLVIHPYFPESFAMTITQLFDVNLVGNLFNTEWRAWSMIELFKYNYLIFALFLFALGYSLVKKKIDKRSLLFLIVSLVFLVGMFKTRRMHEYFVPFAILYVACVLSSFLAEIKAKQVLVGTMSLVVLIVAILGLIEVDRDVTNNHFLPWFYNGATWLSENAEPGSLVFNNAYTFNYLYFYEDDLFYTHGIDLTHSYLKDSTKFNRYIGVLQGKTPGYNIITQDYNADYVFVGKVLQDVQLFRYLSFYPDDFTLVYEDETVGILKVNKE